MKKVVFSFIDKHKYLFFIFESLLLSLIFNLLMLFLDYDLTINEFLNKTFFYWGFFYPVAFAVYEQAVKKHNLLSRENENIEE